MRCAATKHYSRKTRRAKRDAIAGEQQRARTERQRDEPVTTDSIAYRMRSLPLSRPPTRGMSSLSPIARCLGSLSPRKLGWIVACAVLCVCAAYLSWFSFDADSLTQSSNDGGSNGRSLLAQAAAQAHVPSKAARAKLPLDSEGFPITPRGPSLGPELSLSPAMQRVLHPPPLRYSCATPRRLAWFMCLQADPQYEAYAAVAILSALENAPSLIPHILWTGGAERTPFIAWAEAQGVVVHYHRISFHDELLALFGPHKQLPKFARFDTAKVWTDYCRKQQQQQQEREREEGRNQTASTAARHSSVFPQSLGHTPQTSPHFSQPPLCEFLFYTDVDVLFYRDVDSCELISALRSPVVGSQKAGQQEETVGSQKTEAEQQAEQQQQPEPPVFLLGAEEVPNTRQNSGVMLINTTAWALHHDRLLTFARSVRFGKGPPINAPWPSDQATLERYFIHDHPSYSALLPNHYNWKGYWGPPRLDVGPSPNGAGEKPVVVTILHFHGPKPKSCLDRKIANASEACPFILYDWLFTRTRGGETVGVHDEWQSMFGDARNRWARLYDRAIRCAIIADPSHAYFNQPADMEWQAGAVRDRCEGEEDTGGEMVTVGR